MSSKYADLEPGQEISRQTFVLDSALVSSYEAAVGDDTRLISDDGCALVPPMAVAAISLRGVIGDLGIPGGTVHAGQEIEFSAPVPIGETLECRATLAQNSTRGEWRFMVVGMNVENSDGKTVMKGKSTLVLPADA